jgi:hypothetical protein
MKKKLKDKKKSDKPEQPSPDRVLAQIGTGSREPDRLQGWDPAKGLLWYACGDGHNGVQVSSARSLNHSRRPFRTKLTRQTVKEYRQKRHTLAVHGMTIFAQIKEILRQYVHFTDARLYLLVALWVMGTYVYCVFSIYGYLHIFSRLLRSGKTRLQEILSHLAFEASAPLNAPTPPVIRDFASEGGTVQLDTLERWREKSQESFSLAMDILDAGFRQGGKVPKMIKAGEDWRKEEFPVYAPYVLTGINEESLSDTARDRSLSIEMTRKSISDKTRRYRQDECEADCKPLRDSLYTWGLTEAGRISSLYRTEDLSDQINCLKLQDRAADIWLPIFAVAQALGFDQQSQEWTDLALLAREMGKDPEAAEEARRLSIVQALQSAVPATGTVSKMTQELGDYLGQFNVNINENELGRMLGQWGFSQESARLSVGPRRVWVLTGSRLKVLAEQLAGQPMTDSIGSPNTLEKPTTVTTKRPDETPSNSPTTGTRDGVIPSDLVPKPDAVMSILDVLGQTPDPVSGRFYLAVGVRCPDDPVAPPIQKFYYRGGRLFDSFNREWQVGDFEKAVCDAGLLSFDTPIGRSCS